LRSVSSGGFTPRAARSGCPTYKVSIAMEALGLLLTLSLITGIAILLWFRTKSGKKWLSDL